MPDEQDSTATGASTPPPGAPSTPPAAPAPAPAADAPPAGTPPAAPAAAPAAAPGTPPAPAPTPSPAPAPAGAPETYETFTAPEGMTLDEGMVGEFSALAKELNLTQDQAQRLVDLQAKAVQSQADAHRTAVQGWREAVQADKEVGGDKLPETIATAQKAMNLIPAATRDELKQLLDTTGFGNHPAVVKAFAAIGKLVSPDGFVQGGAPAAAKPMFPNSNMNRNTA